jgi:hypothetical protein
MQSFFIATRHFSVQNKVMQDQEQEKTEKSGRMDKIWGALAIVLLIAGVLGFYFQFNDLPRSYWRDASKPLPWEGAGVRIKAAEAYWKSSAGDDRMALRSYNFPVCRLQLDEASGKGDLLVRFINSEGIQMGDRIYVSYADGKFIPREHNSGKISEQEAIVRQEAGFLTRDEYILHQLDEHAPLWRVVVECRPAGGEIIEIGHICILPNDI